MCIAILTTPNKALDEKTFRRCFNINRDGFGMAFINDDGKVEIDKGFMAEDYAWKSYMEKINKGINKNPMLLHFRLRTAGSVDQGNCHPFAVKGGAMVHNGTFWRDGNMNGKSDSRILAETYHDKLHYANLSANKNEFQDAFGYNRVAFLFNEGKYIIFSEEKDGGQWDDGIWYSNGGWKGQYYDRVGNGNKGGGNNTCALPDALDDFEDTGWLGYPSRYGMGANI